MTSLVNELQREALDNSVRTPDLLRKALVAARKLKIDDIQPWLRSELNGYSTTGDIPEYRSVHGEIKAFNPYNGMWMPIMFTESSASAQRSLTNRKCSQSVAELEDLIASRTGMLIMPYSPEVTAQLTLAIKLDAPPVLVVSAAKLRGILDATRTAVLEWALRLEELGVTGESFSFSKEEQTAAAAVVFNIGSMSHSQIQGGTSSSKQTLLSTEPNLGEIQGLAEQLRSSLSSLSLERNDQNELSHEIKALEAQLQSPKPESSIIRESLSSIRTVLEGATGNALATEFLSRISTLLGG